MNTSLATSKPSKAQTEFREWVRSQGCTMGYPGPVQIHHVVGRTAKHLGVPIGHEFILPVSEKAHRIVERWPKEDQKQQFLQLCVEYFKRFYELPFGADVLLAIMDWHR